MKYRHRITGDVIDATVHVGAEADITRDHTILGVTDGDRIFRLPDGTWEKAPADHPFWADYDEVVETRVVKVEAGKTVAYHAERLTERGWVRGSAKATQALAEADMPAKPVEAIVKTYEGGVLTAELAVGDNPETAAVETTFWQKVKSFVGLGDVG